MQALSGVGSWFANSANLQKLIPGALSGAGFLSNWLAARGARQREQFMQNLAENPAAMNKYIAGFKKPLSAGLTANVGNQVQGYLGERGLSESPNLSADVMAQALAPYEQQSQQLALQSAMESLGLMPGKFGSVPGAPQSDLSGTLAMLMKSLQKSPAAPSTPTTSADSSGLTFGGGPFDLDTLLGTQVLGGGA